MLLCDPCGDNLVYILSACVFALFFFFCFVLFCLVFVCLLFVFFALASRVRMYEPVNYNSLTGLSADTCATKGSS